MSGFTKPLVTSPLPDGKRWVVMESFHYDVGEEDSGVRIHVSEGFITDGTSAPRWLWTIVPRWGKAGQAAVVHDYNYYVQYWPGSVTFKGEGMCSGVIRSMTRREADLIFLEGMEVLRVHPFQRYLIYFTVRTFGWWTWRRHRRRKSRGHTYKWICDLEFYREGGRVVIPHP